MRVALIMFYDENIKEYGDINFKINKMYCNKYNIDIILSNEKKYEDRHPAWERLPFILENIKQYDYLIWIDADAFFYYEAENIIKVIENNSDKNFIFSNDIKNNNVNTGIFIVKNSKYSIDFLNIWAYDENLFINNHYPYWWDQGVLIDMIEQNILDIQNNSVFIDYGILQHFYERELLEIKKPFIYHMAGKDKETRILISQNYLNIVNILMELEEET